MRRAERLEKILGAGAQVLAERGPHGFTMRDVARGSATALASLYHYVGGKDDLRYQVERWILEAAVASARATLAAPGGRERLRAFVTDHVRRVLDRPAEAAVLAGTWGPVRGERGRRLEDLRREYHVLLGAAIAGVVRSPPGRPPAGEGTGPLLLAMADRLALLALARREAPRPAALAARTLSVFLDGVRRPGR